MRRGESLLRRQRVREGDRGAGHRRRLRYRRNGCVDWSLRKSDRHIAESECERDRRAKCRWRHTCCVDRVRGVTVEQADTASRLAMTWYLYGLHSCPQVMRRRAPFDSGGVFLPRTSSFPMRGQRKNAANAIGRLAKVASSAPGAPDVQTCLERCSRWATTSASKGVS